MGSLGGEINMDSVVSFIIYFLFCLFFRNSAMLSIKEGVFDSRFFPKHFALPSRFLRKFFGLKKTFVPKFLIFRLYVSIIFGTMAPIVAIVALVIPSSIVRLLFLISICFIFLDTFQFLILLQFFRSKKKK